MRRKIVGNVNFCCETNVKVVDVRFYKVRVKRVESKMMMDMASAGKK